ncbi:hypothetical protein [Bacillus phage BC-T25]|nr:hypothetical protein [Bacillus phage BC-T25]
MYIVKREAKEFLEVYHNSEEEMAASMEKLKAEGWSRNTRTFPTISLPDDEYESDKEWYDRNCPGLVRHPPEESRGYHTEPFVYYSEHERDIKEEK